MLPESWALRQRGDHTLAYATPTGKVTLGILWLAGVGLEERPGTNSSPKEATFPLPCFLGIAAEMGPGETFSRWTRSSMDIKRGRVCGQPAQPWLLRGQVWPCRRPRRSGWGIPTLQIGLLHLRVSGGGMILLGKFLRQEPLCILLLEIPHQQGRASHLQNKVTRRP